MFDNRWLNLSIVSLILFIIGYYWPLKREIRLNRKGLLQDVLFWVVIVDFYFYPFLENAIEGKFNESFREFFSFLGISNFLPKLSIQGLVLPLQFLIIFLVLELINYGMHRFVKHGRFFWNFHKVHHSSQEMDQFSDARNHPLLILIESFFIAIPTLIILNPTLEAVSLYGILGLIWGPLIHHNIKIKWFFPLSHILSSPHLHRWHHAREQGIHCNYSGIFIFYDVIFGTFYSPSEDCEKIGFVGDEDFPQSIIGMLFYPFKQAYAKISSISFLSRKNQ